MISIHSSPLITNLSLYSLRSFSIGAEKARVGRAERGFTAARENKGSLLSRTAYLSYHKAMVYLETVLGGSSGWGQGVGLLGSRKKEVDFKGTSLSLYQDLFKGYKISHGLFKELSITVSSDQARYYLSVFAEVLK